jgi:DNA polymerase-1
MNMLIRSFSLLKAMNPLGHHVGGLVGFLRSLGFVTRTFDPTRVIIVWDGKGGSANRKNIDPNYKAQRATSRITHWGLYDTKAEETEALIGQLFRTQDYLECLPVQQLMMEKLEADDIIAYLAKTASGSKKKLTIVSSDKDFLQLVDEYVEVYAPVKKKTFTKDNIEEEL